MPPDFTWGHPEVETSPAQFRFEEARVRMALEAFDLGGERWGLLDDHEARFGVRRLTFAGLRGRFPTFPVVLEARYVGRVGERVRPSDLLRRFGGTFLSDYYLGAYARHAGEAGPRAVGLVVPFDGYRSGVVVHNGDFESAGTRIVHRPAGGVEPHRITAEPYDGFLRHVSRGGWTPAGGSGAPATAGPAPEPAAQVAAWMVRRLGSGPAVIVLGWVQGVLAGGTYPAFVRRAVGRACVAATREEIAGQTGLSPDAVKRALEALRREGLVVTYRRDGRTIIELVPREEPG
jgi:DNA-binding transcriptional ArsR family regulator